MFRLKPSPRMGDITIIAGAATRNKLTDVGEAQIEIPAKWGKLGYYEKLICRNGSSLSSSSRGPFSDSGALICEIFVSDIPFRKTPELYFMMSVTGCNIYAGECPTRKIPSYGYSIV